jgi:hypothetical protein
MQRAQQGEVGGTVRSVIQLLTRETPQAQLDRKQAALAEIATALTSIRGKDAQDALIVIDAALRGQPVKTADAAKIGRLIAGATALSGYQATTRPQSSLTGAQ